MQDGVYDSFLEQYTKLVSTIKVGYGLDEDVTLGPLVNSRAVDKVWWQFFFVALQRKKYLNIPEKR